MVCGILMVVHRVYVGERGGTPTVHGDVQKKGGRGRGDAAKLVSGSCSHGLLWPIDTDWGLWRLRHLSVDVPNLQAVHAMRCGGEVGLQVWAWCGHGKQLEARLPFV